jgi:hypothetical protein
LAQRSYVPDLQPKTGDTMEDREASPLLPEEQEDNDTGKWSRASKTTAVAGGVERPRQHCGTWS